MERSKSILGRDGLYYKIPYFDEFDGSSNQPYGNSMADELKLSEQLGPNIPILQYDTAMSRGDNEEDRHRQAPFAVMDNARIPAQPYANLPGRDNVFQPLTNDESLRVMAAPSGPVPFRSIPPSLPFGASARSGIPAYSTAFPDALLNRTMDNSANNVETMLPEGQNYINKKPGLLARFGYAPSDDTTRNDATSTVIGDFSDQARQDAKTMSDTGVIPDMASPGNTAYGSKVHPITSFDATRILNGSSNPVHYSSADIDEKNKVINVKVRMNYDTPWLISRALGFSSRPSDEEFQRYATIANEGIAKYWSRNIKLNGEEWAVNVTPEAAPDGMPLTLANPGAKIYGELSSRSRNPYPLISGTLYYDNNEGEAHAPEFARIAAHEFGHPILTHAFGREWSWGHEGTSSLFGSMHDDAPPYPERGEISLMPYYMPNRTTYLIPDDIRQRTIASEDDVKTLIHVSGRNR